MERGNQGMLYIRQTLERNGPDSKWFVPQGIMNQISGTGRHSTSMALSSIEGRLHVLAAIQKEMPVTGRRRTVGQSWWSLPYPAHPPLALKAGERTSATPASADGDFHRGGAAPPHYVPTLPTTVL